MWRLALLAFLLLIPASASAASPAQGARVVLLRPPTTSGALAETLTRVQGELVADGFRVTPLQVAGPLSREELLAFAQQQPSAAVLVGLFAPGEGQTIELWVVDQLSGNGVVTRVEVSAANPVTGEAVAPEVLARRAVEVLRATLLKLAIVPSSAPLTTPARPAPPAAAVVAPPEQLWGVEGGLAVMGAVDGPGLAAMPVARLRLALGNVFMGRLSVAGFGTRPRIEREEGSADIDQQLMLLELVSRLWTTGTLRPRVGLGMGAYHVVVEGAAASPYRASRGEQWAFAASAGAGLSFQLSSRWALELELHAMLTAPYPVVEFVGAEVAQLGRPSLSSTLTLAGWL